MPKFGTTPKHKLHPGHCKGKLVHITYEDVYHKKNRMYSRHEYFCRGCRRVVSLLQEDEKIRPLDTFFGVE